jgi:ubiquinol oxidase
MIRGWIRVLLEEAENERMHLMTFIEIASEHVGTYLLIVLVQARSSTSSFALSAVPRTAHRIVGYFEEEARDQLHTISR